MENLEALHKYFFEGSAEREQKIRNEVFIKTPAIKNFYSELQSSFILLKSQKGIGKTFFIDEFCSSAISKNILTLKIRPEDFDMEKISSGTSIAAKSKAAYEYLIRAISVKIGEAISDEGLHGLEYNNLIEAYRNSDSYIPSMAEKALKALRHIPIDAYQKIVTGISKISDEFFHSTDATEVLAEDITKYISEKDQQIYVFIDDIDNARNFTSALGQAKFEDCWAIISASFDLATKISNIKCIVSIRDDIWLTIKNLRIGTDKSDKINCIVNLVCDDNDIYNILNKRLSLASRLLTYGINNALCNFFSGAEISLPGIKAEQRAWPTWLCKQSRNRPRDLVQLVEMLIREARGKSDIINSDIATRCLAKFCESRLANARDEFCGICDKIEDITLRFKKTRYSYKEITDILKKMPSTMSISVNGQTLQPGRMESAIAILSVLYIANIMNARIVDTSARRGFNHITFEDKNNFITMTNLDELQKCEFEIHPVFHSLIASHKNIY